MSDSEESFQMLEVIDEKIKNYIAKTNEGESSFTSDINETLIVLFTLLFDFTQVGQRKVAKKCGNSLVQLISRKDLFRSYDSEYVETVNHSLLIISAICNYDSARSVLVEETASLKICIDALVALKGNDPDRNSLRDKFLSCLSTLLRGYITEAVDAGVVNPMIDLLGNEEVASDQKGAAAIILCLIEPEKGQALGARILLSGVVPMLFRTLAKRIPEDASESEKIEYRHLKMIGLRCVACILRHQKLARESAGQFFATEEGENHLKVVVEFAKITSDVSKWLFAAEVLVWLGSVKSCQGLLGRMGAKEALQQVVAEADPHAKWKSLYNQAVSVKTFPALWTTESMFYREQHAFLALWMTRYACAGPLVSVDAYQVREKLCSEEWMAFATTLLASPDTVTRRHAHTALLSLRGDIIGIPAIVKTKAESSRPTSKSSNKSNNVNKSTKAQSSLYSYLLKPLGLEISEEKKVIECLTKAKLPLHIILRPRIHIEEISKALSNLPLGTKLAVIDGIKELREKQKDAEKIVKNAVYEKMAGTEISTLQKQSTSKASEVVEKEGPECFISYCWAQKDKVKILRSTLEDHGISCWMDEQQMEGGDMLFEEIDDGISASDVVISCLSPEYTKSVNCNREVLLATDRKKATIPIVLDALEHWPPRGNLGPILAGKLYIKINDEALGKGGKSNEIKQLIESVLQLLNTSQRRSNHGRKSQ